MPWITVELDGKQRGYFSCPSCGLVRDPRPLPTVPWVHAKCGSLVDDGLEFQRALARGDDSLWRRCAANSERWQAGMEQARRIQAGHE